MPVLVYDPLPIELETLLERRRAIGADRHDEMWQGVLHMAPAPQRSHAEIQAQLLVRLDAPARAADLRSLGEFNLGGPDDYRVPDAGLLTPGGDALYLDTATLVVEILSPDDGTWEKLPFYAAHRVDELLIVDPLTHVVQRLALTQGGLYEPIERSNRIELSPADLAAQIDLPPAEA
jgi:Uma2 family endonuclease